MILHCEPRTHEAYRLLHNGTLALARAEAVGLRVDTAHYKRVERELTQRLVKLEQSLPQTDLGRAWASLFRGSGVKMGTPDWDSGAELGRVLNSLGVRLSTTEKGNRAVDEDTLRATTIPGVEQLLAWRKFSKLRGTYVASIMREQIDGVIHPFFHLAQVATYRSSCSNPNFQNMPIRDEESGAYIRRGILPRPGHLLLENDYKGIEVKVAFFYHQDPTMFTYLTDPTRDMHRDMACDCYLLEPAQVTKAIRYLGKNGFVFPEFYGSYYKQVAPAMWRAAERLELEEGPMGTPLMEHLLQKFGGYPAFEDHIREVEHDFWYRRFPVYRKWRERWWIEYQRRGYFDTLTGFRCGGTVLGRNQSINYPVQGSAFHCLLWSLIQLDRWITDEGLDSRIVGQIHDSILQDMVPVEVPAYLAEARMIMRDDIRERWPWITLPLDIETEAAPVDGSWYEKEPYEGTT